MAPSQSVVLKQGSEELEINSQGTRTPGPKSVPPCLGWTARQERSQPLADTLVTFLSAPKGTLSVLSFRASSALVGGKEEQIFFSWQTSL